MKTKLFTKIIKLGKSRHGLCFSVCNITAGAELDVSVIHEMWFGESCGKTRRKCKKLSVCVGGVVGINLQRAPEKFSCFIK